MLRGINVTLKRFCTRGPYFLRFCVFLKKKKATLDKVSNGSVQKCSKELKKYSFISAETMVVKLL